MIIILKELVKLQIRKVERDSNGNRIPVDMDNLCTTIWMEPDKVPELKNIIIDEETIQVLFKDSIKVHQAKGQQDKESFIELPEIGSIKLHEIKLPKEYLNSDGTM